VYPYNSRHADAPSFSADTRLGVRGQTRHALRVDQETLLIRAEPIREGGIVCVEAYARLHFGVLDLRGAGGRWFGGIGAAAAAPSLQLSASRSDVLIVEGEERTLRPWDFFHCATLTKHTIVGAGDGPCIVIAIGARANQEGPGWGGYTVDETAARHNVSVDEDTNEPEKAYASWVRRQHARYRKDWLP